MSDVTVTAPKAPSASASSAPAPSVEGGSLPGSAEFRSPSGGDIAVSEMIDVDREKFLHVKAGAEDKFDVFVQWISENGGHFPKLHLKEYAEGNRGVHATQAIEDKELVMSIPYKCIFTVEMGKATSTGQLVLKSNIEGRFDAPKHIYLMLFLLIDSENPESFFQPYYNILPQYLGGMPIFWSKEEYSYLKGSYLLNQCQMRKDAIRSDYEEICDVDPTFERFSLDRFAWARMIVCSRNFGGNIRGTRSSAMVPMADMLNHYRPRETRWGFDEEQELFTIHSCCPIGAGDSVYDSYGKKCQHRFLLNYGFSIEDNREPDGRNPNQIHMTFDLLPESEDTARQVKQIILEKVLHVHDTQRGIRVSTIYTDKTTKEAFSYLRFIHMTEREIAPFYARCQGGEFDITKELTAPVSLDNEEKVLRHFGRICMAQLKKYDTTWDDDKLRLAADDGPQPFTNERNALIYMAGEKEICHFYIDLMMECVKYIRMLKKRTVGEARKLQAMLREKYAEHDQLHNYSGSCEYVTHAIIFLLKATFGVRDGPPAGGDRSGQAAQRVAHGAASGNIAGGGNTRTHKKKKKKKKKKRGN